MPTAYLWCPAYPLRDEGQLVQTRAGARRLALAIGHDLIESPSLAALGGPGAWPEAAARAAEFEHALGYDLLLAARGGYGCVDLAPLALAAPRLPRLLGYSDLTVLHACWRVRRAGETCYGYMPGVPGGERALATAVAMLRGEALALEASSCPGARALVSGRAEGELFAACLRVLASLAGTPAMPALDGCLLALEDVDERPYRIDRDLAQLHACGALRGVRALLFGSLRCTLPPDYAGPTAGDIAARWAARLGVPALVGLPIGHEADPLALPCGRKAALEVASPGWSLRIAASTGVAGRG
jgi:muramoyltetrapeptide carboxypeptidase